MREIKFRAWDKLNNCMRYFKEDECIRFSDFKDIANHWSKPMQYTGLKDKNCKEIYEGDIGEIIEMANFNYLVIFKDGMFGVETKDYGFKRLGQFKFLEIIGNIYKNPELLK